MSFFSADYRCINEDCRYTWDAIVPRDKKDEQRCPICSTEAERIPSIVKFTKASFIDGNKRFAKLRQEDQVQRVLSEAQAKGDSKEVKRALVEVDRVSNKRT